MSGLRVGPIGSITYDPGSGVLRSVQDALRGFVTATAFGAVGDGSDESAEVQDAADVAKATGRALRFAGSTGTVYAINNVDVAGLDVYCDAGVTITAPAAATGYAFIAIGTSGSRVTTPTRLHNFVHDGDGTQLGLFNAEYCDDPYVVNCIGSGYPMTLLNDGTGVRFTECKRPLVLGGKFVDGRTGVGFTSCTTPTAMGVKTEHQGRDGIVFYTDPSGTTTTDALADGCVATDYCINGEAGRAGIHFYGVRRAKAVGCTGSNDNAQTNDDTGAIRFRDCEDFACTGYTVFDCRSGVLVNEVGDYAGAPHNIVVRGAIGAGTVDDIGKYGIFVTGGGTVPCSITGAEVSNVADIASAAGIYHGGVGTVTGCTLSDMACRGVDAVGNVSVTGNTLLRCGKGSTSIAAVMVGGTAMVGGNQFVDDRGGSATSTLAIRVISGGTMTYGVNAFGAGITDFVLGSAGSTVKRGSAPIPEKFAGVPASLSGTIEAGVLAEDTNGVFYRYSGSAWRRVDPRMVTATVGTSSTTVAHGLGYTPTTINALPAADARVWESATADGTNVYLQASVSVSCKVSLQ